MSARKFKTYALNQSPLYQIRSKKKLAFVLKSTWKSIEDLLSKDSIHLYFEYERSNGDGDSLKKRYIEEPCIALKRIQRLIDSYLSHIESPSFLHSPAKNCSQVTNASIHRNSLALMKLDIKAYFVSTSSKKVYYFFNSIMRCAPDISTILTSILTYRGRLPTGSPSSPRLAYFSHLRMWESIYKIVIQNGYLITVYMDDITISGNLVSNQLLWDVKKIIHSCGLKYHKQKIYFKQPFEVTGIIIKDNQITAPNRQLKKLNELEKLIIVKHKLIDQENINLKIQGYSAHIRYIRKSCCE
jgi:Reverse transcriptase (RNA-dependent DNA polymerase)